MTSRKTFALAKLFLFFLITMSLFIATLFPGVVLLLVGGLLLWNSSLVGQLTKRSLRSMPVTVVAVGLGAGWFLYHVAHLGEADFGQYKLFLFFFFLTLTVFSFFYIRDFLVIRGAAVFMLMVDRVLLDAAYMETPSSRLFLVSFVYVSIALSLYLGWLPYKLRDFFEWLFAKSKRSKIFGSAFACYGLLLCVVALTY